MSTDIAGVEMATKRLTSKSDVFRDSITSNTILGLAGNDTIYGNAGNDVLDGGTGKDRLYGGKGNDTYVVDNVGDKISETSGQGKDLVKSSINWSLASNVEDLTLTGSAASGSGNGLANTIKGNAKANALFGNGGNDILEGGDGDDQLVGGTGNDLLRGGAGLDLLLGGPGTDRYEGGTGLDIVAYFQSESRVEVYLWSGNPGNKGDAAGESFNSIEAFIGSKFNDILALDFISSNVAGTIPIYGAVSGYLDGDDGDDVLNGSGGKDLILGGQGADSINGGNGNDTLSGGAGNDKFYFTGNEQVTNNYSGFDTVNDFSSGDQILLFDNGIGSWNVRVEGANTIFYLGGAAEVTITGKTGLVAGVDYIIFDN